MVFRQKTGNFQFHTEAIVTVLLLVCDQKLLTKAFKLQWPISRLFCDCFTTF